MKALCFLIVVLFYFNSSPQGLQYETYPNMHQLWGMEDGSGNTHLFYRVYSQYKQYYYNYYKNDLYHLDVLTGQDSLYLHDYFISDQLHSIEGGTVNSFNFFKKDPLKLIYSSGSGAIDFSYGIRSYFEQYSLFDGTLFPISFITTYKNSDSVFAFVHQWSPEPILFKYKGKDNAGFYLYDTLGHINAISHSPYHENVYFADSNEALYKSVNEGRTKYLVDNTPGWSTDSHNKVLKTIFYDKNQNYIYRLARKFENYKLMVSNNSGEPGSWTLKYTSQNEIFLASDDSASGLLYLADGRYIYKSTNYGSSFSDYKTLDNRITGLYKKPASDKLYVSTAYYIYEITNGSINIIKVLFEKDQLKFDPLDVGNKWVYNSVSTFNGSVIDSFITMKEVVKDTISNGKVFRKIQYSWISPSGIQTDVKYQRNDTVTGLVYLLDNGNEYIADDLKIMVNDTIYYSRYFYENVATVLKSSVPVNQFNINTIKRNYNTSGTGIGALSYSLVNGFGLTYLREDVEDNAKIDSIKGCRINGIVYGDTNTIVGVNDQIPNTPDEYSLYQNYPNPFNPSTAIEYAIPQRGMVSLKIYDLLGREVSQLVNKEQNAGRYKVQFNAGSLSSGIYFYKLESGSFIQIRKLMLLK